jgi:hypothetical protein
MRDKGYAHPLFSLNLIAAGVPPDDDPRYAIPDPGGSLVTRTDLRLRGQNLLTQTVDLAVCQVIVHHQSNLDLYTEFGLDDEWNQSMSYWRTRLLRMDEERYIKSNSYRGSARDRQGIFRASKAIYKRLSLAAQLCGKDGTITRGQMPKTPAALLDAMTQAATRAGEQAALLAENGFGAAQQERLSAAIAALSEHEKIVGGWQWARQETSDALSVLRGALVGDMARLSHVAPLVVPPAAAAPMTMRRLRLTNHRPESRPAGTTADAAGKGAAKGPSPSPTGILR